MGKQSSKCFLLSWIGLTLYHDPRWTKQNEKLNNSRIPKFRVSSIYELHCTRFFVSLRKLMTCKLCSFFIASRWSPSSTVQFITNWQRRSLAERFKFPVYKTTACLLASKQNCTRILRLQNVHLRISNPTVLRATRRLVQLCNLNTNLLKDAFKSLP